MSYFSTLSLRDIQTLAEFAGFTVTPTAQMETDVTVWIDSKGMHAGTDGAPTYREILISNNAIASSTIK